MTTLLTDTFTGTDGAALNTGNWVVARATTGASATIQSNRARLNAGTLADYGGAVSIRANIADRADAEWQTSSFWYQDSQDGRLEAWLRCDDIANPGEGYFLGLVRYGTIGLHKAHGFAFTSLATASFSFSTGVGYKLRFRVVGTTVQAKVWAATDTEPSMWTMSVTDSEVTAAGECALHVQGGGSASLPVDLDDVTLTDGTTGLTRVSKTVGISADVRQRVSKGVSVTADVRARVSKTVPITANVESSSLTRVSKTVSITADVRQRVSKTVPITADVLVTDDVQQSIYVKHNGALVQIAALG